MERRNLSNLRLSELFNIAKLLDIKYRVLEKKSYMFRLKNDCLVTIRNLLLSKTIVYNARIFYRGVCRYVFCVWKYSGKATAAVRRYSNACIRANGGHFEHLL
jgi:hypothetical protein